MWELYDALIAGIDESASVDEMFIGADLSFARSGDSAGICGSVTETWSGGSEMRKYIGMPLRELAQAVKSWDFIEARLGAAAINAYYNSLPRLRGLGLDIPDAKKHEDRANDPFIQLQKDIRGKTVTVIGHFPYIDQLFAPVCDLKVIEKFYPKDGDYPEQAAEYLLHDSEYAFISSYTIAEKSLPRLLAAAKSGPIPAHVTLVGPASPVTPIMHSFGVDDIAGYAIRDIELARSIAMGFGGNIHATGQKVNLRS